MLLNVGNVRTVSNKSRKRPRRSGGQYVPVLAWLNHRLRRDRRSSSGWEYSSAASFHSSTGVGLLRCELGLACCFLHPPAAD